jgi:exopolysaccharide biosynthesis polyprenyl glycosylphosphotransferase
MRFYLLNLFASRVLACLLLDVAAFGISFGLMWQFSPLADDPALCASCAAAAFVAFSTSLYFFDAYSIRVIGSFRSSARAVICALGLAVTGGVFIYGAIPTVRPMIPAFTQGFMFYAPLILLGRWIFRNRSAKVTKRVVIMGTEELATKIARALFECRNMGLDLVGFLSDQPDEQGERICGLPVLGTSHEVDKVIERHDIDSVVVAGRNRSERFPAEELLQAKLHGHRVESGVQFYERLTGRVFLGDLRPSYLIFSEGFRPGPVYGATKRAIDIFGALVGLTLGAPLFALCALAVKLDSPGPIFFRQQRVGEGGTLFDSLKFRSMSEDAEDDTGPVFASVADSRITRVGRFLRRSRFDELPQLWNILRGDMSLVGPRPERPAFQERISERVPYFSLRSTVKPGLTGWAQIRQGYTAELDEFEEKFSLDLFYLKHRSASLDLFIMLRTLRTVVLLEGI